MVKYIKSRELWNYSIVRSCRICSINSRTDTPVIGTRSEDGFSAQQATGASTSALSVRGVGS